MWWLVMIPAVTTCTQIAGGTILTDRTIHGHDIRGLLLGEVETVSPCKAFYFFETQQLQAVRSGPWKLFVLLETYSRHLHFLKGESTRSVLSQTQPL